MRLLQKRQEFKMDRAQNMAALVQLGAELREFAEKDQNSYNEGEQYLLALCRKAEIENSWFTLEKQKFAFAEWGKLLQEEPLKNWLSHYKPAAQPKKVGLILAGNIPMVGFHDVLSVVLSNHIPLIKLSSKDKVILPYLMKRWAALSNDTLQYEIVEKLTDFDAVIATGSNNTARYLEYYFKDHLSIIRKNRTSVAVLTGEETNEQLRLLAEDIFRYFGLGCRNVTRLFIPADFKLDRLFENFLDFKEVINHHKYANNYEYNRAVYLLNQEPFWDNNFVMLRQDDALFSPLSVINFSRYSNPEEVLAYLRNHEHDIQAVVSEAGFIPEKVSFGEAQHPALDEYADRVDTMRFLEII